MVGGERQGGAGLLLQAGSDAILGAGAALREVTQACELLATQGHQRGSGREGVQEELADRWFHPRKPPTLPDARTPQSPHPPLCVWQRIAGLERETLEEVIVVRESGYTQQKVQPRQPSDDCGQGSGEGRGAHGREGLVEGEHDA